MARQDAVKLGPTLSLNIVTDDAFQRGQQVRLGPTHDRRGHQGASTRTYQISGSTFHDPGTDSKRGQVYPPNRRPPGNSSCSRSTRLAPAAVRSASPDQAEATAAYPRPYRVPATAAESGQLGVYRRDTRMARGAHQERFAGIGPQAGP